MRDTFVNEKKLSTRYLCWREVAGTWWNSGGARKLIRTPMSSKQQKIERILNAYYIELAQH